MITIINNINTTVTVGQVMGYSLITLILLLLLLSLRNIIGEVAQNQRQIRILVQNLNLISIPLLIMFTVLIIVYYS